MKRVTEKSGHKGLTSGRLFRGHNIFIEFLENRADISTLALMCYGKL
jgi:hypothetical protein